MYIFGIVVTVIYFFAVVFIRWPDLLGLVTIPLNEFGDFLAGVFGPLMLFWVVLGYYQQQKELKQNTEALKLQAEELKQLVEQNKALVRVNKESVRVERNKAVKEAQPEFSIKASGMESKQGDISTIFGITVLNSAKPATRVTFTTMPAISQLKSSRIVQYLGTGDTHKICWVSQGGKDTPEKLKLIIDCIDSDGYEYQKSFDMVLDVTGGEEKYQVVVS